MSPRPHRRHTRVLAREAWAMVVLVRDETELGRWPLMWRGRPDLSLVDDLARLQLSARRLGCAVRLRHACADLWRLLDLVGLGEVFTHPAGRRPSLQALGQAEGGEELGVEEVVVPDDPIA